MKRYDLALFHDDFERPTVIVAGKESGRYVLHSDLQARDLKMAELVRALPHVDGCRAAFCRVCDRRKSDWRHAEKDVPTWHDFSPNDCGCEHSDLLAMLETTNG